MARIALSLVGMRSRGELAAYLGQAGSASRFELSYKMTPEFLDSIESDIKGKVLSVHACCPETEYFPNFASLDPEVVERSFRDMDATLETALRFGASIVVLHAGYATDLAMPSTFRDRSVLLGRDEFKADIRYAEGAICGPEYIHTEAYLRYAATAKQHLVSLAARFAVRGVRLAVENLNPRVAYLFHAPEEMVELAALHPDLHLCLDVGHLYISSFVYGFDFLDGVAKVMETGKVATTHIHSNPSGPGRFFDVHDSVDRHGFPIGDVLEILIRSNANMVIEAVEEPVRNTMLLREYLRVSKPAKTD